MCVHLVHLLLATNYFLVTFDGVFIGFLWDFYGIFIGFLWDFYHPFPAGSELTDVHT